jgi:ATP-dependent Lon protease
VEISDQFVRQFEKLLVGGIWCIVTIEYFHEEGQKTSPFIIRELKPIQMPNMDMEELFVGRSAFTEAQWIDVLMRSTGMEPTTLSQRAKWHMLARMVPLVENNYNCCELGPKGTRKSHIYKEISPSTILISGGQTTVANLFYNMGRRTVGLVGYWDVVAFDEVAGITFKENDGIQIMKDYMASGSFARGKDSISAYASMVFVGNISNIEALVKTSHLLAPFPEAMIDTAFLDRFQLHAIPDRPKMGPIQRRTRVLQRAIRSIVSARPAEALVRGGGRPDTGPDRIAWPSPRGPSSCEIRYSSGLHCSAAPSRWRLRRDRCRPPCSGPIGQ